MAKYLHKKQNKLNQLNPQVGYKISPLDANNYKESYKDGQSKIPFLPKPTTINIKRTGHVRESAEENSLI